MQAERCSKGETKIEKLARLSGRVASKIV